MWHFIHERAGVSTIIFFDLQDVSMLCVDWAEAESSEILIISVLAPKNYINPGGHWWSWQSECGAYGQDSRGTRLEPGHLKTDHSYS